MINKKIIFIIVHFFIFDVHAQKNEIGTWNVFNFKYNSNNNWSFFTEGQIRSLKLYNNFHYYEYKAGVSYKIDKNLIATIGGGSYQTYKEGGNFITPKNNNEFRIWPQIVMNQSFFNIKIEQRYRTESRFTSNGYKNRFRYRLGLIFPFGKEINNYKPYQISASNEIFFTDKEPYFERNRMLITFNYKPSKTTSLQIGYLHQFDYKINDETGRDFLQLGYNIELFSKNNNINSIENEIKDN